MGEWIGWVWLREAQHAGVLGQWAAGLWMGIGGLCSAIGACGLLKMLIEAIDAECVPDKAAAADMGLKPPKFSEVRKGELPVTLQRLDRLPAKVLAKFGQLVAEAYMDDAEIERRALLYLALLQKKRMARAHIAPAPMKEEAAS